MVLISMGWYENDHSCLQSETDLSNLKQPSRPAIPVQPQVHILGRGSVPDGHYQFSPGFKVKGVDHHQFHLPPHIPAEEREAGKSRFYQWHFDGALYDIPPPRVSN
jgi:xanthine dioxygenase